LEIAGSAGFVLSKETRQSHPQADKNFRKRQNSVAQQPPNLLEEENVNGSTP